MVRRPPPIGLTLVELLVVLSIIGVLMAILLPAIGSAREAARKTQCKNNIRQLALGCSLHEQSHCHFPVGRFYGPADHESGRAAPSWSWLAELLPEIEEQTLYDMGDIPNRTHEESGVCDQSISLFLCPSIGRSTNKPRDDRGGLSGLMVGLTNYHAASGANWGADLSQKKEKLDTDWRNEGTNGSFDGLEQGDGMMCRSDYRNPRRLRHVADGNSHTFMIGEVNPATNNRVSWPYANNAYSTCAIPPNLSPKDDGRHEPDWWENVGGFRSEHPMGLHFAMVDGSVHFIGEGIDLTVYRAMATIAGTEVVASSNERLLP